MEDLSTDKVYEVSHIEAMGMASGVRYDRTGLRSLNVPKSSCHMLTSCQQTGRLVRQAPTLLSIPLFAATDDNEIQSKSMRCWYRS
eukprot:g76957.t1